jgi:lipopolysaccharide transport system permease protein
MILGIINPRRLWEVSVFTSVRLITHRRLLADQLRRELLEQHAGHMLGGGWLIVHPLFLMAIYVFVFAVVFKTRMGGTREMPLDYTAYILSGLIPWLTIQQALSKSCTALTQHASLIKQVVFPIEILPARAVLSTLLPFGIMVSVLICYVLITQGSLPLSYLLLPVLVAALVPWLLGIGLLLSGVTVFVRDIREVVTMFLTAGVFMLPIMYLPAWVPGIFKPLIYANPFSYIVWCFQDVLYFGRFEHPWAWPVLILGGFIVYALGSRGFQAVRPYFGDAL